jgi:hypothetical protein
MRRLAGISWRLAVLIILMAGVARGQEQLRISTGARDLGNGDSFRLASNYKNFTRSGVQVELSQTFGEAAERDASAKKTAPASVHRFWDKQNIILFAGVGVARGLDYSSTLNMRRRGNNEWLLDNATVDNHAEFAAIEVATAAASVGLSYIFHATGHHKLERWTSYLHIGGALAGAGWNYSLKTVHPM